VVGSAQPEAIAEFREATGYESALLVDPSRAAFRAAGLRSGLGPTLDPRGLPRVIRALASGARQGPTRGSALQQGGTFVLGPGDAVSFEWRDRFSGDHAPIDDVLAAIPRAGN
jgi:alkyl-hydroperoxide reductase/thiol specific antioxidant family protein